MSETEPVQITIVAVRPLAGRSIFALIDVELVIAGVPLAIHGIQARHVAPHGTSIHLPTYRAEGNAPRVAVTLPSELLTTLGDLVLEDLVVRWYRQASRLRSRDRLIINDDPVRGGHGSEDQAVSAAAYLTRSGCLLVRETPKIDRSGPSVPNAKLAEADQMQKARSYRFCFAPIPRSGFVLRPV